jgi:glucose/arabinose dehydrogenase
MHPWITPTALVLLAAATLPAGAAQAQISQPQTSQPQPSQAQPSQPQTSQAQPSQAQPSQAFLTAIDDVPLAPGLVERPETLAVIEGPEGRILTVQAAGAIEAAALTAFYDAALPALGFERTGQTYIRARQRLSLAFRRDEKGLLLVTFRLIERPASLRLEGN